MERREVIIDRQPPKRLLAKDRWRTFKTGPDMELWRQCMSPVQTLQDDGYRVTEATIVWGKSYPGNVPERTLRLLLGADIDATITTHWQPAIPRGQTIIRLER